jgi:AraC family transcriptional regulator
MLSNIVIKELPIASRMTSEIYSSDTLAVFKSSRRMSGEYAFSSYSFIMPMGEMPPFIVDNKKYNMHDNKIFPINPGQLLKSTFEQAVDTFWAIHIDSVFMQEIADSISNHSNVFFKNESVISGKLVRALVNKFIFESIHKQSGYKLMLQSISTELAIEILRHSIIDSNYKFTYKIDIKRAIAFLEERYQDNITLDDIAKEVKISRYHLSRLFKSETGKTPFEFLMDIRVRHAKRLLANKELSMTDISSLCGFSDASHFSFVFKKKTGFTPSDFRNYILK